MRIAALVGVLLVIGCGSGAEAPTGPPPPLVGKLELPVSMRAGGTAPTGGVTIEIGPDELRADGVKVVGLSHGELADGDVASDRIPALAPAVQGKGRALLRMHASTPYGTAVRVLSTLEAASIHDVTLSVRTQADPMTEAYLALEHVRVLPVNEQEVTFDGITPLEWAEFVRVWDDVGAACAGEGTVDCAHNPGAEFIAQGGRVQLVISTRQDAVRLEAKQVGVEVPDAGPPAAAGGGGAQMIEGVPAPRRAAAPAEPPPPLASDATFTLRTSALTATPSPMAEMLRPLCGPRACGVLLDSDELQPINKVISLLTAGFPDGTAAPQVVFRLPNR